MKAAKPGAGAQSSQRRKGRRRRKGLPRRRDGRGGQAHSVRRSSAQETKGKSQMMGSSHLKTGHPFKPMMWNTFFSVVFHFFLRDYKFLDLYSWVCQSPFPWSLLGQGSAGFIHKEPHNKYCRLCGPTQLHCGSAEAASDHGHRDTREEQVVGRA